MKFHTKITIRIELSLVHACTSYIAWNDVVHITMTWPKNVKGEILYVYAISV